MDIGTVMTALQTLEQGLSITAPAALATKRAYLYIPERQAARPEADPICFFNGYSLVDELRGPNGQRRRMWAVDIQALVAEPSHDTASQIASAFLEALDLALFAHQTLSGAATNTKLKGKTPTLTRLEWDNQTFMGFQVTLDVLMEDSATAGA